MVHLCFTYIEYNSALDVSVPRLLSSTVRLYILHHIPFRQFFPPITGYICSDFFKHPSDPRGNVTTVVMLGYDWWLRMVINISVQYSSGLLPDIILLTQGYYQWGTRLNAM